MEKKKTVLVGTGHRGISSYVSPIVTGHLSDAVELCGVYDLVKERAELCGKTYNVPVYYDFEEMLNAVKPDFVIVTCTDSDHHDYIIRALEAGYDVASEKPMTNTVERARAILEAEKKSGKRVYVTFNCRYMQPFEDLKRVISSGVIGDVRHVDLTWLLDRKHGTSYYRRWHGKMKYSNSLLLHKSTHHFDLVNWIIGKEPESVFADCKQEFYGKNGPFRGKNCRNCDHTAECPFYWDATTDKFDKEYFVDLEPYSGYCTDNCVFGEDVDIYDNMALLVKYTDGTTMNYSLTTYNSEEGSLFRFIGTKGRIEFSHIQSSHAGGYQNMAIKVYPVDAEPYEIPTEFGKGDHGGGDSKLRDDIFRGTTPENDPLGRCASSYDGYLSLLIGALAVESEKSGKREFRPADITKN